MKLLSFYFFIATLLILSSCKKEETLHEDPCLFTFDPNTFGVAGLWEPRQIINLEDNDTLNFQDGEGHTGFILGDYYADALELRSDGNLALYYVTTGRFCTTRVDATWTSDADSLYINFSETYTKSFPILSITKDNLTVEDVINFKKSKATYYRVK